MVRVKMRTILFSRNREGRLLMREGGRQWYIEKDEKESIDKLIGDGEVQIVDGSKLF